MNESAVRILFNVAAFANTLVQGLGAGCAAFLIVRRIAGAARFVPGLVLTVVLVLLMASLNIMIGAIGGVVPSRFWLLNGLNWLFEVVIGVVTGYALTRESPATTPAPEPPSS